MPGVNCVSLASSYGYTACSGSQCRSQDLSEGPQRSDGRMGGVRCARAYRHQRLFMQAAAFCCTWASVPIFQGSILFLAGGTTVLTGAGPAGFFSSSLLSPGAASRLAKCTRLLPSIRIVAQPIGLASILLYGVRLT